MNLLLDTHVALWVVTDSPRLSAKARELIGDEQAQVWVSVVSLWEIAIKHALGKGEMPLSAKQATAHFAVTGFKSLAVQPAHVLSLEHLPPLHTDPFDRLLVAQALAEPLRLLTHDSQVARYSDAIILV